MAVSLPASQVCKLAICVAKLSALPTGFHTSMFTVCADTGSTTVPVALDSASVARSSIKGDNAVNLFGKATDQWLVPMLVTVPLLMTVWAMAVPTI